MRRTCYKLHNNRVPLLFTPGYRVSRDPCLANDALVSYYRCFALGAYSRPSIGSPISTRSSRGLGHRPFTAVTRVQIPYESPHISVGFTAAAIVGVWAR